MLYRLVSQNFIAELLNKNYSNIPTTELGFISTSLISNIAKI